MKDAVALPLPMKQSLLKEYQIEMDGSKVHLITTVAWCLSKDWLRIKLVW